MNLSTNRIFNYVADIPRLRHDIAFALQFSEERKQPYHQGDFDERIKANCVVTILE